MTGRRGAGPRVEREAEPSLRLTRRGRVVLVVTVAMIALALFWLGTRAAGVASTWQIGVPERSGLPYVTVGEGDTLWEIADALDPGDDPRPLIRQIMVLNNLPDTLITPGARLYLPPP